jgi:hypothetical protein
MKEPAMAAAKKSGTSNASAKVYGCLSLIVGLVLLVGGICACNAGASIVKEVNEGLVAQKIYFPPKGSPAFAEAVFPDAQEYAGKQVVDGPLAKAYAEDFLGVGLKQMAGGKVLSEISAQLAMDPGNAGLQQLQAGMFQAETSKTLLLVSGYGSWAQGNMMKKGGTYAAVVGGALLVLSGVFYMRAMRP